jgi:NitT/TauT family transport system substrate-binding protein
VTRTRRAALAVLAGAVAAPAALRAQAVSTLRLNGPPSELQLPLAYAQRAGLFERAGIRIERTSSPSGAATLAAIAGGANDIGITSMLGLLLGHARGVPFTIVAPSGIYQPSADSGVLVPVSSPMRTAKDLEGKTYSAAAVNDITLLGLRAWMDQNGADSSTVKIVEVPQSAALAALEQGRVDGIILSNPAYTIAMASGKVRRVANTYAAIAPRFLWGCWFSTTSWVERNRAVAERFARVLAEASTYVNGHVDETLDDLVQLTGLDRGLCQRMHRTGQVPNVLAADIQPVIDAAVKYKLLDHTFSARDVISEVAVK